VRGDVVLRACRIGSIILLLASNGFFIVLVILLHFANKFKNARRGTTGKKDKKTVCQLPI
jgi:hypothetical protein